MCHIVRVQAKQGSRKSTRLRLTDFQIADASFGPTNA